MLIQKHAKLWSERSLRDRHERGARCKTLPLTLYNQTNQERVRRLGILLCIEENQII